MKEALVEIIYQEEKAFLGMHHDKGLRLYVLKGIYKSICEVSKFSDGKRTLKWTRHATTIVDIDDRDNSKLLLSFSDGSKVGISPLFDFRTATLLILFQFTFILGDGLRPFIFLILNFLEARTTN